MLGQGPTYAFLSGFSLMVVNLRPHANLSRLTLLIGSIIGLILSRLASIISS